MRALRTTMTVLGIAVVLAFGTAAYAEDSGTEDTIRMEPVEDPDAEEETDAEEGIVEITFDEALLGGEEETEEESEEDPETGNEGQLEEIRTGFDEALFDYIRENGQEKENFMVSPVSLKAALCLAAAGAEGDTLDELLQAMRFDSEEEMEAWLEAVNAAVEEFSGWYSDKDHGFAIANSIWNNSDRYGSFLEEYQEYVKEHYSAEAYDKSAAEITGAINSWCSEKTNGLIRSISDDLSRSASVLVNALYLKTAWYSSFGEFTWQDAFTDIDGNEVEKEFMSNTDDFYYYGDEDTQLVILPLEGDKQFVAVLGDQEDLDDKINQAAYQPVHVMMPKFEVESTFMGDTLISFLQEEGTAKAFTEEADFSGMCTDIQWYINDIIQKTKLNVDENGLEAAAVTAIVMTDGAALPEDEPEPVDFIANRPFTFYIYSGLYGDTPIQLFAGQYVK